MTLSNLDVFLQSSNVANIAAERKLATDTIALADAVISDERFNLLFPDNSSIYVDSLQKAFEKISKTHLNETRLRQRWRVFTAMEVFKFDAETAKTKHKLKRKTKSYLIRVTFLHKLARKVKIQPRH
jgi:hypothetical protein